MVAGGGAGGAEHSGGGGAGGFRTGTGFAVTAQGYTVTVGGGGTGVAGNAGNSGSDSVFLWPPSQLSPASSPASDLGHQLLPAARPVSR